ncbi:Hypothetical predicted protein [Prunus dulcis]|uniref:Uncharacterized protein n=1 Tax=Prunus dulcis TaxID=3755 RepID=A0A5E4GDZ4_PRUDU|nr:Hypothetical predicted protein [Prunus dulcis]
MNLSNETNAAAAAADEIEVEDIQVQAAQPKQASLEQLMIHMLEKWITKLRLSKVGRKLMVERATASPRRGNNTPRDAKLVEIPAGTSNWFRGHTSGLGFLDRYFLSNVK